MTQTDYTSPTVEPGEPPAPSGDAQDETVAELGTEPDDGSSTSPAPSAAADAAQIRPDRADMIAAYFKHVPLEDQPRSPGDVLAVVDGHWRVGRVRRPGEVAIRVFNPPPSGAAAGWSDKATVINIVNDDMPYLVDSTIGALTSSGINVHRVLHPILSARRDVDGELLELTDESARLDPHTTTRESWMHVLVDRLSDASRAEALEDGAARGAGGRARGRRGRGRVDGRGGERGGGVACDVLAAVVAGGRGDRGFPLLADLRESHLSGVSAVRAVRRRLG